MKHFYNPTSAASIQQLNAKALGTAIGSKIFSLLFVCLFLLVSGEGFAQTSRTLYAKQSGDWDSPSNWEIISGNGNSRQDVATGPSSIDNVIIDNSYTITVNGTREISNLELRFATGNSQPALVINGELTINNMNLNVSNNATNSLATLTVNGNLTIKSTATWSANGKYDLKCGESSIVIYDGVTNILPPQTIATNSTVPTPGTYNNLILGNTGTKTASSDIQVRNDLVVRGAAVFAQSSFTHSVGGNLLVEDTGASINGSSTGVSSLTVGGNVINSGNIAFQTRVLSVGGNFTNNIGGIFTAGGGTHTISGNWANGGTFSAGTGTIVLNGLSKTISSTGTGAFNNLTISGGSKSLLSNIRVNGSLGLSNAILNTGPSKVVLGNAATISGGETATQNITGTVETTRPVTSGADQTFGGIGFVITNSNADFGQVTVTRTTGTSHIERNEQSARRQYTFSSTSGTGVTGTSVAMRFPAYDLNAPIESLYDLYKFVDQSILRLASSVPNDPVNIITTSDLRGMYTLYSSQIAPLPVELVSFKAQRHTKGVNLTWTTASELDNKGFEVQVSTDSRNFTAIGFVESKVGTTALKQYYNFLDIKAVSGTRYYRLKQIDFDGQFEYSPIKSVILDGDNGVAAAYPNPFNDMVTVKLTGTEVRQVKATLTDAMGKVILETTEETAGNSISVNTGCLSTKGLYLLHVLDNGNKHTFKLMKR
jgi:hypothetical protein